eukprot:11249126-Prorocentrum_lima.AAC.1
MTSSLVGSEMCIRDRSIKMQQSQGTLRTPTSPWTPYKKGMRVNYLPEDQQRYHLEGPVRDRIQDWWKEGTTKECMLSA